MGGGVSAARTSAITRLTTASMSGVEAGGCAGAAVGVSGGVVTVGVVSAEVGAGVATDSWPQAETRRAAVNRVARSQETLIMHGSLTT